MDAPFYHHGILQTANRIAQNDPEAADDYLQEHLGCRFGQPETCEHGDCKQ